MSADSGETWIPRNCRFPGRDAQQAKINPVDSNHWVVTTSHGFYQSFNAGALWALVSQAPTAVISFSSDGNNIFVGTGSWTGVRSKRVQGVPSTDYFGAVSTDIFGPTWSLLGSPRIFRSTNKGLSWSTVTISDLTTTMVNGIVVSPINPSIVWATIGFNVSAAAIQQGMTWDTQISQGNSRKLVYSTDSGSTWSSVLALPPLGTGAGFGVTISPDGTRLAVAAAVRVNGTAHPLPYNATLAWKDQIYVGTVGSSGAIDEMYKAGGLLPSGGRAYRYLEFDQSSSAGSIIRASAANIVSDTYGHKEGMQTGYLSTCVWNDCTISWYGNANGNVTQVPSGWENGAQWQTYSGASSTAQAVFATSSHGVYSTTLSSTTQTAANYGTPWQERYSQGWNNAEGYSTRGWDALEVTWVAVHPDDASHIFIGASEQLGYESYDAGFTWTNIATQARNDTYNWGSDCSNPQHLYPCYNHTGILDRSRAGDFVGGQVPLLMFGATKFDLNATSPSSAFGMYVQYWNGTFDLVAGGFDKLNYDTVSVGSGGLQWYEKQDFEATAVIGDSVFRDTAVVGFDNGMVWVVSGCEGASTGDAATRMTFEMLFGWSITMGQTKCESVTGLAFDGNATSIFIQCKSHLFHVYFYPVGGLPADFGETVVDDNRYLIKELFDRDLSAGAIGGYMARSVHYNNLDSSQTYMIDEHGLVRMPDHWTGTIENAFVIEPLFVTVLTHEAADAIVRSCVGGMCPTVGGNISSFALLDERTIAVAVKGGSESTVTGRGVFLVHFADGEYNNPSSYTVISGAISMAAVKQFVVTSSTLLAVTEGRGLWSYAYNLMNNGDFEETSGWLTSGTVTMSDSDDSATGLVALKLSGAGSWAESVSLMNTPQYPEPLNIHFSVKFSSGAGVAIFKFFDSNGLATSHREYPFGTDTNTDWHSLFWRIFVPVRAATFKVQLNCSSTSGSTLALDHLWMGPSSEDTAGPAIGAATAFTEYLLPKATGTPLVVTMGGESVNTAYVNIKWTAPVTTWSGPIWYYEVWKRTPTDSSYSFVGITYALTYNVADLYRATEMLFRVHAVNKVGKGPASEALQVVTVNTVPNAPTNPVMSTPSTASTINIKWDAPADTGGVPLTSYMVWLWSSNCSCWDAGTRYNNIGTSVTYRRLDRATQYKFKVLASNAVGDSVVSSVSSVIETTVVYEPTITLRFMLKSSVVLNSTVQVAALNNSLSKDLANVIKGCNESRFYLIDLNETSIFRMLKTTDGILAKLTYLSTPTDVNETMYADITKLNSQVITAGSNLHTQGITTRNLDYGYWKIDWHAGEGATEYEWELGMFEVRDDRLSSMAAIVLGLLLFCLVPGLILKWVPFYRRLADQGLSNSEIFTATIRLWYSHVARCCKKLKRMWDKHCQPWFAKRFKACRKQRFNADGSVMDPTKALLLDNQEMNDHSTQNNETAQVMKVH